LNDHLRKEFRDGQLLDVTLLNNDRIIEFKFSKSNDFYDKEIKYLVVEVIPHKSNLILLNSERKIVFALHNTTLESYHIVMKGLYYEPPKKNESFNDFEEGTSLKEIENYAEEYLLLAKEKRLKEKYEFVYKYVKTRIKSLKSKILVLKKEIEKANENLTYQEHGNMLLACLNDKEALEEYIKEHHLKLDEDLSIGQNANVYFKKYKKAKRTIEMDNKELIKTLKDIEKLEVLQAQLPYMNDEDMFQLVKEYFPHKLNVQDKKKAIKNNVSFIQVNNTKIYYGKNAKQNEEITFKIGKKDEYYFHIKDYHGSHVVVANSNPTNEEKLIAAELCLILSGKNAGDVQFTQLKNVKKGGSDGLALLNTHQLITIKNVREGTFNLLKKSK
jgi:predicted ribosome quality control (RQC) complex YloA/Tae2 family protein